MAARFLCVGIYAAYKHFVSFLYGLKESSFFFSSFSYGSDFFVCLFVFIYYDNTLKLEALIRFMVVLSCYGCYH